jgi:hypothetical protein
MFTRSASVRLETAAHLLSLLLLPVVLTLVIPDWRISSGVEIDPWVYHGFFPQFREYVTELFAGTYSSTRLGWLVPGYVAYLLFQPPTASLALHGTFYVAAVVATYDTVRGIAGASRAFAIATTHANDD